MTRNLWGWGVTEAAVSLEETQARIEPFFGPSQPEEALPPRLPRARVEVPAELRAFSSDADEARARHAMGTA